MKYRNKIKESFNNEADCVFDMISQSIDEVLDLLSKDNYDKDEVFDILIGLYNDLG